VPANKLRVPFLPPATEFLMRHRRGCPFSHAGESRLGVLCDCEEVSLVVLSDSLFASFGTVRHNHLADADTCCVADGWKIAGL